MAPDMEMDVTHASADCRAHGDGGAPQSAAGVAARPEVSVVICTYDRPLMLEAAIRSCLANATQRALDYEIVVADNSVDGHAAGVVGKFKDALVPVRSIAASPPNISIARNAGIHASRAPLVAFVDDDTMVEPGWLDHLVDAIRSSGADVAVGRVDAKFTGAPSAWDTKGAMFSRNFPAPTGTLIPLAGPKRPRDFAIGTSNSLWRAETSFTDPEPFDPWFGAAGGEDTDLFLRLARRGRQVVWCAEAGVWEIVPDGRTEFSNQLLRVFSSGQGYAAANIKNADNAIARGGSIMMRGAIQAAGFGLLLAPLGVLKLLGIANGDTLFKSTALRASVGLGKACWWRRLSYYHLGKSQETKATV